MATTIGEKVMAAKAAVPVISAEEAIQLQKDGRALIVDVRDHPEVQKGKAKGAVHASRGTIEFKADPSAQTHNEAFDPSKTTILYCGSGGRAALAGQTLMELGYTDVRNMGGYKDWVEAGGETE